MTTPPAKFLYPLVAATLFIASLAQAGLQTLTPEGRARTPDGERSAQLSVEPA